MPGFQIPDPQPVREQEARVPASLSADAPEYFWAPLAAGLFAALGAALWWSGAFPLVWASVTGALARPAILLAAAGLETAFSLLWLCRVYLTE